jgi:hypothetical protein
MGGMAGGGGGGGGSGGGSVSTYSPPPAPFDLQTTGWGGMGPTATPQTFTQASMPYWMQPAQGGQTNWFAAPWWGMNAVTGQPLQQQDLQYQPPAAPPAAPAPAPAPAAPSLNYSDIAERLNRNRRVDPETGQFLGFYTKPLQKTQDSWRNFNRNLFGGGGLSGG